MPFGKISFVLFAVWLMSVSPASAKELFTFTAEADFAAHKYTIKVQDPHSLTINVEQKGPCRFEIVANVDHWVTPLFDISTIIDAVVDIVAQDNGRPPVVMGKINSQYTLIDFLPVQDFYGQFQVRNGALILDSILIGEVLCKGRIGLASPHKVDLRLQLADLDLYQFLNFLLQQPNFSAEGSVSGDVFIAGDLAKTRLRGHLTSEGGRVNRWTYNDADINLEGYYPVVELSRSTLVREDGLVFGVTGALDLSQRKTYVKQIRALKLLPYVEEGGEKTQWTLKRSADEGRSGKTEFKYFMRKTDPDAGHPEGEDSGVLGVEHKLEW